MWERLAGYLGLMLVILTVPFAVQAEVRSDPNSAHYLSVCNGAGQLEDTIAALGEKSPSFWDCSGTSPSLAPDRTYLRFDLEDRSHKPNVFIFRRAFLGGLHTAVFDEDGSSRVLSFTPADLTDSEIDDRIKVSLPQVTDQSRYVVVAFDEPTHKISFADASLDYRPAAANEETIRGMILRALLAGFLLMPLLFNLIIYGVLREKFVLWHGALTTAFALHVFVVSGMLNRFFDLSSNALAGIQVLTFAGCVCGSLMFARSVIERNGLSQRVRDALLYTTVWTALASILHTAFPFILRSIKTDLYYAAFLPVFFVVVWMLFDSLKHGSRASKFIAAGWAPIIIVGVLRLIGQLTPWVPPMDAMWLFHIGAVSQVTATALCVADKFLVFRQQRDHERKRTGALEEKAEQDPLTGLLNRRAIDERFDELHREGYECFALLDLDRFKSINDRFGHMIGDEVLRQVAEVLKSDPDAIAIRMGGEEFMLFMRGPDAEERAETMRQAISLRVAREVDGLDRIVTASMGLINVPLAAMPHATFADVYSRADKLLYDAKAQGRNRKSSERLSAFSASPHIVPHVTPIEAA